MLYLVQFEYPEPGPLYPPERVTNMVERSIAPSLEAIAQMEKEGRVRGAGVVAGSKSSAMIIDASDNNELSSILQSLPFWSFMKVHVTPLQSFPERAQQEKQAAEFLRSDRGAEMMSEAW